MVKSGGVKLAILSSQCPRLIGPCNQPTRGMPAFLTVGPNIVWVQPEWTIATSNPSDLSSLLRRCRALRIVKGYLIRHSPNKVIGACAASSSVRKRPSKHNANDKFNSGQACRFRTCAMVVVSTPPYRFPLCTCRTFRSKPLPGSKVFESQTLSLQ